MTPYLEDLTYANNLTKQNQDTKLGVTNGGVEKRIIFQEALEQS